MNSQIETEKALIGAILIEPSRVLALCQKKHLTKDAFNDQDLREAYHRSCQMLTNNQPIDTITLATKLEFDALPLLNKCLENSTWTHAESYVDILLEAQTKRKLLEFPKKITDSIRADQHPQDVIQSTISELQTIQKSTEQDVFEIWKLSDITNYVPDPANYIAGLGWIRRGAGTLLTGGTGIGKSILAEQISLCVASGINIIGCISVKQGFRVLHVQAENDQDTLKRDIESIIKNINPAMNSEIIEQNFRICHAYGLCGHEFAIWLRQQCEKFKPDFINIDPYQAYIPGEMDINSSACFLSWIRPINAIIRENNCALMLVAHTPKPKDRESWTARESVYMAAGSSSISNWARTSAELTQAGDEDGRFRLRFGKNCERTGITNENGGTVRDMFINHSGSIHEPYWKTSEDQSEPSKSKYKADIIRCATDFPDMSQRDIAREVGCSLALVSKWYPK
jgi:hypothetical protein